MKRKRRHLTAEFKARVAVEALKEDKTIRQIAIDEDIAAVPEKRGRRLPTPFYDLTRTGWTARWRLWPELIHALLFPRSMRG
jgi:hypothetical protein